MCVVLFYDVVFSIQNFEAKALLHSFSFQSNVLIHRVREKKNDLVYMFLYLGISGIKRYSHLMELLIILELNLC